VREYFLHAMRNSLIIAASQIKNYARYPARVKSVKIPT